MKTLTYCLLATLFFACNNPTESSNDQIDTVDEAKQFQIKDESLFNATTLRYAGKLLSQRVWQDANGDNALLFTRTDTALFAYHYLLGENDARLMSTVSDGIEECDADLFLEFMAEAVTVTDLDEDNIGEFSFAYEMGCISDLSPLDMTVYMIEGNDQYTMDGYAALKPGDMVLEESSKDKISFAGAPASFLMHAHQVWNKAAN
ncbi:MAG: hypothetical protein AAGI23_02365 [Bacteroidota bacterium]